MAVCMSTVTDGFGPFRLNRARDNSLVCLTFSGRRPRKLNLNPPGISVMPLLLSALIWTCPADVRSM